MSLPLYKGLPPLAKAQGPENMGLWFERFYSAYPDDFSKVDARARSTWLKDCARKQVGDPLQLKAKAIRLRLLAKSQQGAARVFTSTGPFVSGTGNTHPLENGFSWHPTLGTPYIPGSAVKGLLRALIETAYESGDKNDLLQRWFGTEPTNEKEPSSGQFIFMDALPIAPCDLHVEVMTPHMGKWYANGQKDPLDAATQPGDWHAPIPITYLVARNLKLQFIILPRTSERSGELPQLFEALEAALEWLGAGAKTAIGFGQFRSDKDAESTLEAAALSQLEADEPRLFDLDRLLRELQDLISTCSTTQAKSKDRSNLAWKLKLAGYNLKGMTAPQREETERLVSLCIAFNDKKIQAHIDQFFSERQSIRD